MKNYKILYALIIIVGAMLFSCELDPDFDPNAPLDVTAINNLAISAPSPLTCDLPSCAPVFTATSDLVFPNTVGDQVMYTWDFGDGSAEVTGNDITHTYTEEGAYNITLKANATGATEVSIDMAFTVTPKNTFIAIVDTQREIEFATDIIEVSDGFILMTLESVYKYDTQGNFVKSVKLSNGVFTDFFSYADFYKVNDDSYILFGTSGENATFDSNISFQDINPSSASDDFYLNAVREESLDEPVGMGSGIDGFFTGQRLLSAFQSSSSPPFAEYFTGAYTFSFVGGSPIVSTRFPKHIEIDDNCFMPIFSNMAAADQNNVLMGISRSNMNLRFTPTFDYSIGSISDGQNNNILTLGSSNNIRMDLREYDKTTGAEGRKIDICQSGSPGEIIKVSDGYVIANTVDQESACLTGFNQETAPDIQIQKFDFQFNPVWKNIINQEGSEDIWQLKEATDGGFLIIGNKNASEITTINPDISLYLMKTNSEGKVE